MQKQITCNLNKSRLKQPNAGGVCYVTHFRTYIITHDRGQREAASAMLSFHGWTGLAETYIPDPRKTSAQPV